MTQPPKITWRVDPKTQGKWARFQKRNWPSAFYDYTDGQICAALYAEDGSPYNHTARETTWLRLRIADYRTTPWQWKVHKQHLLGINAARVFLYNFLMRHPEFVPLELRHAA